MVREYAECVGVVTGFYFGWGGPKCCGTVVWEGKGVLDVRLWNTYHRKFLFFFSFILGMFDLNPAHSSP